MGWANRHAQRCDQEGAGFYLKNRSLWTYPAPPMRGAAYLFGAGSGKKLPPAPICFSASMRSMEFRVFGR